MADRGIIGSDNKIDASNSNLKYTVSEGSTVVLDANDFLPANDIGINNSYTWQQIGGDRVSHHVTLSFTAPYVGGNDVTTGLRFKFTIKDNKGKPKGSTYTADVIVKRVQRAMIFQGGVALGVYEAGVFHALVKKLSEQDKNEGREGFGEQKRPLFDIIAGTSIGGMNAAVVLGSIRRGDSWQDAAEKVKNFWKDQEYPWPTLADFLDINPMYRLWWDIAHNTSKALKCSTVPLVELYSQNLKWYGDNFANWFLVDPNFLKDSFIDGWYIPAAAEAARRYYSVCCRIN